MEYNSSQDLLKGETKRSVKEIHFNNIRNDGFAEIICDIAGVDVLYLNCISYFIRRHAIDMLHLIEEETIEGEMGRAFRYLTSMKRVACQNQ